MMLSDEFSLLETDEEKDLYLTEKEIEVALDSSPLYAPTSGDEVVESSSPRSTNLAKSNYAQNDRPFHRACVPTSPRQRKSPIVKQKRANRKEYTPTLHAALSSKSTSVSVLRTHLLSRPATASVKDRHGRFPLHLLSTNHHLFETSNKNELQEFVLDLFKAYPLAAVTPDNEGKIPFSYALSDWVEEKYADGDDMMSIWQSTYQEQPVAPDTEVKDNKESKRSFYFPRTDQSVISALTGIGSSQNLLFSWNRRSEKHVGDASLAPSVAPSLAPSVANSVWSYRYEKRADVRNMQRRQRDYQVSQSAQSFRSVVESDTASAISASPPQAGGALVPSAPGDGRNNLKRSLSYPSVMQNWTDMEEGRARVVNDSFSFPKGNIEMSDYVSWCLQMLDTIYSSLLNMPKEGREQQQTDRDQENDPIWLSKVLVATLSSIPNFAKLLLFCSNLRKDLPLIPEIITSPYAIGDWIVYMIESPNMTAKSIEYLELFQTNDNQEFERISYLDYIIPAILAIEDTELVDRAARTKLWEYIVREKLSGELLSWVVMDFIMHILLLVSFQVYTNSFLSSSFSPTEYTMWLILSMTSILYLGLRKLNKIFSELKITQLTKLFGRYNGGFWNWVEGLGIIFSFAGLLWMHINFDDETKSETGKVFLVVTTALIWLNVLGWLRIVNRDIALFSNVLGKIIKSIRNYVIILAIVILSFSQMFNILQFSSCSSSESQCINPYLQTYSTALGSFDVLEYTNTGTTVLSILLTSLTILLLFTTLISIVYHSYSYYLAKSTSDNTQTERFIYLAHTKVAHILVASEWTLMQYCACVLFLATVAVLLLLSMESKRSNMMNYYGKSIFFIGIFVILLFMTVSILAFLSHISFYDYGAKMKNDGNAKTDGYCRNLMKKTMKCLFYPMKVFVEQVLFGSTISSDMATHEGQIVRLQETIHNEVEASEAKVLQKVSNEMKDIENHIHGSLKENRKCVLDEVKFSREKLEDMMVQIECMVLQLQNIDEGGERRGRQQKNWEDVGHKVAYSSDEQEEHLQDLEQGHGRKQEGGYGSYYGGIVTETETKESTLVEC